MIWLGETLPIPQLVLRTGMNVKHCIHVMIGGNSSRTTGMNEFRSSNDSMLWLICMLNDRVTTPAFCYVLPSIVLPSIPSLISWQCHLTPASLSCRQTKWFHNQYERRCNPACFRTLKQTGNNWIRRANQIRNNQCNKNESAYRVIGRTSILDLPVDHHDKLQTKRVFIFGTVKPAHVII